MAFYPECPFTADKKWHHLWVCLRDVLEHGGDGDGLLGPEPRLLAPQLHAAVPPIRYETLGRKNLQRWNERVNGLKGIVRASVESVLVTRC